MKFHFAKIVDFVFSFDPYSLDTPRRMGGSVGMEILLGNHVNSLCVISSSYIAYVRACVLKSEIEVE